MTESVSSSNDPTNNAGAIVGIVVALPEELSTLTGKKLAPGECCPLHQHWVCYGGAGAANAAQAARTLIGKGVQRLMSWGCAAGLREELKPGDLVIPECVVSEQVRFDTDAEWRSSVSEIVADSVKVSDGALFCSGELVCRSQEKRSISRSSNAVALDMESAAVAEVAAKNGLAFLAIRCIADPVAMDLPQAVVAGLNAQGQVELLKLLAYLFRHPWEVFGLAQLGLHFRAAQKTLRAVASRLGIRDKQTASVRS